MERPPTRPGWFIRARTIPLPLSSQVHTRHHRRYGPARIGALLVVLGAGVAALIVALYASHAAPAQSTMPVGAQLDKPSVADGELHDGSGHRLQLQGVGRSGSEYVCLSGKGIFAGPTNSASVSAMASWGTQVVRLPLNEDCWLGINHVPSATSGAHYRAAIASYVNQLAADHLDVILDLHWSGSGDQLSDSQQRMPDASHSNAFWAQVAHTFANRSGVIFEIYNEPYGVSWSCWLSGCYVPRPWKQPRLQGRRHARSPRHHVRDAGADNPVIVDGLEHASSFSGCARIQTQRPSRAAHRRMAHLRAVLLPQDLLGGQIRNR